MQTTNFRQIRANRARHGDPWAGSTLQVLSLSQPWNPWVPL